MIHVRERNAYASAAGHPRWWAGTMPVKMKLEKKRKKKVKIYKIAPALRELVCEGRRARQTPTHSHMLDLVTTHQDG